MRARVPQELGRLCLLRRDGMDSIRKRSGPEGRQRSESFIVPISPGNPPEGPGGGKGRPEYRIVGGKDGTDVEPGKGHNETTTNSGTGTSSSETVI